jgi:hypothetical protein
MGLTDSVGRSSWLVAIVVDYQAQYGQNTTCSERGETREREMDRVPGASALGGMRRASYLWTNSHNCSSNNVATGETTEQTLSQYPSLDLSVANPGKEQVSGQGVSCLGSRLGSPANFWTSLIRRFTGERHYSLRACRFFCKVLAASGPNGHQQQQQTAPCCVYNAAPDRATQHTGTPGRAFKMVPLNRNSCICVIRPSRMVLPVPSYPSKWIRSLG